MSLSTRPCLRPSGRRRLGALAAAAGTVAAVLAATGASSPALARPTAPCLRSAHARGNHVLVRDREAVVFSAPGVGKYFGCLYAGGPVRVLDVCCAGETFRVAGPFAAYTYVGSAIGDETNKLGVYDLRTGRLRSIAKLAPHSEGGGREIDTSSIVPIFVITPAGSLAWIQEQRALDGTLGPLYEVRVAAGRPPRERSVDTGSVGPRSLRLDRASHRISWIKDGVRRSAALRP